VSLKKPTEFFEQRRLQSLAEEDAKKEKVEVKNKRIISPKELFGEVVEVEDPLIVEEIVEEPVDPYLEEIGALRNDLERISYAIPEETDLTEVYQDIKNLKNRIDNLPKQKSYNEDIESIREELVRIEGRIPVPEVFDPSDLYENISALKNKLEEVRSEIPTIPEPILYDYQLDQLKEMVVDVRNSIPVVPEIRYYENDLNEIINAIEEVRSEIPVVPEIKYYDDEISTIELRLVEIQESIPTVKYYDDELDILDQKIANVEKSIPVVPEVKYYDKDVKELKEQIASVKKLIPEVKYYDKDVKELKEQIASTKNSIPEVKYYDEDIQGLNEEVQSLYKKVSSIKIPDQDKYIREVKGLYSSFEEKNHRLLEKINYLEEVFDKFNEETLTEGLLDEPPEVKNSDPLTPLDQNFVTLNQLQEHYRLFINRIQQQLSTIGGGGETRLEFLDDVDRNSAKVDGKFLKYDAASGKWVGAVGAVGGGGGSQTLDDTLGLGNTSSLGMSVGLTTVTKLVVDPIGSGVSFTEDLVVKGNARVTGILSIGTGTITIDGNSNNIKFSDNTLQYSAWTGIATVAQGLSGTPNIIVGIVTATKYYGDGSSLTGISAGGITSTSSINTTGIITANSYYVGSTQVINSSGQWVGSGLSVYSNIDGGVPNSVYGGIPVIDGGVP
jgi:prefoldin subunit 5